MNRLTVAFRRTHCFRFNNNRSNYFEVLYFLSGSECSLTVLPTNFKQLNMAQQNPLSTSNDWTLDKEKLVFIVPDKLKEIY